MHNYRGVENFSVLQCFREIYTASMGENAPETWTHVPNFAHNGAEIKRWYLKPNTARKVSNILNVLSPLQKNHVSFFPQDKEVTPRGGGASG